MDTLIEARAALFCPTGRKFQKIYGSVGGIYGGEATCHISHNFYGWGSADYFSKQGKSLGEHDSTKITIVPLGLGLKYFYPVNCFDFYAGGGLLCTFLHMHDRSPDVIKHISKWGIGGTAKVGAIYNINTNVFLDLFTSYSYMKIDFHCTNPGEVIRNEANLYGFRLD